MTTTVIHGESLGKRYRRGLHVETGLRHTIENFIRSPFSAFRGNGQESFWALKDVSLEVREGEVLGLIGRNGAGKTTLLKILSRITRPTTGWAEIHGRVGSLLEVGTGFHPELTGRENTFLSGAILGMSKREIERKFDEIVAFAELEKFIDTQVKHYSSGMYVRLAFAVAAHLEPEILLVDEVLAVGDINFQRKCLGKMGDVARAGRTVVLVSHQLNQIRRLCSRAAWIDAGLIRSEGTAPSVIGAYEAAMFSEGLSACDHSDGQNLVRFLRWELEVKDSNQPHVLSTLGPFHVNFQVETRKPIHRGVHGAALLNAGRDIVWASAVDSLELSPGFHTFSHGFPSLPVRPGAYFWQVSLWEDDQQLELWDCSPEMIVASEVHQHPLDEWSGVLNIPVSFRTLKREDLRA